jgi:hypothetical protein
LGQLDAQPVRESLPDLLRELGFAVQAFSSAEAFLESDAVGKTGCLVVFAKHVVHPERSEKNGVATHPFRSEEAPDETPS